MNVVLGRLGDGDRSRGDEDATLASVAFKLLGGAQGTRVAVSGVLVLCTVDLLGVEEEALGFERASEMEVALAVAVVARER